ncbi:hypothetical protein Tco_0468110 [Tanacetum coccineum]
MANLSKDIQSVGSDTRPPMLDRIDFASWQQRIRLYCMGKDNGANIIESIDEGPFKMGKFKETLVEGEEGALHLGPERERVFADLSPEKKERFKADIRATNILLQRLPNDIYTLINHYTYAKYIWDNVKILLEGYEFTKLINDMRNIKMTMPKMQLNSKFINNMFPEWGRFMTTVKLNKGLKESNYDHLYAYLKQPEAHANENKMMLERYNQHAIDPLALVSNVSPQYYPSQSSVIPPSTYVPPVNYQPQFADNTQLDSGFTLTDDLIENLTKTITLLAQSYKTHIPQTNNQLRTSSNTRNQATIQNGKVVVQNVQGRQNRGQGNYARGAVAAGNRGVQNRTNTFDDDVDEEPVQDLALNEDNVFQADQFDAFDSDVDEAPTAQTMFMENLSSADPIYDEVKTVNGEVQLHTLVDGKKIIINESTVRRDLQLEDTEGIDCLPNSTIFEQLALMGIKTTAWNEFSSTMASAIICLATNQKFNFSKYIFESMVKNLDNVSGKILMYPRFIQVFVNQQLDGLPSHKRIYDAPSHTKKIFENMRRVGKGFSGRVTPLFPTMVVQNQQELGEDEAVHKELGDSLVRDATTASSLEAEQDSGNITKTRSKATPNEAGSQGTTSGGGPKRQETIRDTIAQTRVLDLEKIKTTQQNEIASLKRRVKKVEQKKRSRTHRLKRLHKVGMSRRVEFSRDEDSLGKDASKQGRRINAINADEDITLVNVQDDAEMFDVNTLTGDEVFAEQEVAAKDVNLTIDVTPAFLGQRSGTYMGVTS